MTSGVFLKHASRRARQELLSTTGTGERLSRAERRRPERRNAIAPARQTSPTRPDPIPRAPKLPMFRAKLGRRLHSKRLTSRQVAIAILLGIVAGAVAARAAGFI